MEVSQSKHRILESSFPESHSKQPLPQFTFELLKITKECQAQHGLRHGDYQRYRSYCSRRIARLRSVLKIPQGDRRHYKKRNVNEAHINDSKGDARFLHIPLMLAERCWAYAMQLRQESNTEQRKRFHFIDKLRKSCVYATMLDELAKLDRCDARTKLETQAYLAWIRGTLHFELKLWRSASENLKKAQVIYETIVSSLDVDEQSPYKQRVDELHPSLRYCAYNIGGDDNDVDLAELRSMGLLEDFDQLVLQNKRKSVAILHAVQWFGIEVPIRTASVSQLLTTIENLDASIERAESTQAKIKLLENMFIDLRDVIAEVRKEPKEHLVLSYLLSMRIERTVERNLLLIRITKKPQDVCRLMDIIIQQTNEMMMIEALHDNADAKATFQQRLATFHMFRSFYVARAHAFFRRWKEAVATYALALQQLEKIKAVRSKGLVQEMIDEFVDKAAAEHAIAHANVILEKCEEAAVIVHAPAKHFKSKKPLMERLDEFREDPQLLTKNPNVMSHSIPMSMLPPKPLFFDLALNHVRMPTTAAQDPDDDTQAKEAAGISGFVKGLWTWKK